MKSFLAKFLSFRRRADGTAAVEFALVAPILFLIVVGTLEFGLILFTNAVLEGATSVGARIGKTGYTPNGLTPEDYIRGRVDALSGGYLNLANLQIVEQAYANFNDIGSGAACIPGDPASCTVGTGGGGQIVLYKVTYPWRIFTPMIGVFFDPTNPTAATINITASATVRNEPF